MRDDARRLVRVFVLVLVAVVLTQVERELADIEGVIQ